MNRFLLGGWVARPSAFFIFALALVPCLILFGFVAVLNPSALGRPCSSLFPCLILPHFGACVPVLGIASISTLLSLVPVT